MMELWIIVIGGDDPDERMIAKSDNIADIDEAVEEYAAEVEGDSDKSFWIQDAALNEEHEFFSAEEYEEEIRQNLTRRMAKMLGRILMPH